MQILVLSGTVASSPQIGEILPPCAFFDCPILSCPYLFSRSYAQVEPLAQTTCFSTRMVFLERWVTIFGENMPPKLTKNGRE